MNNIDVITIRNLMLEAFTDEEIAAGIFGRHNFKNTCGGTFHDLFLITEGLALKYNLIEKTREVRKSAWCAWGENIFEGGNTNFNRGEIEKCWEAFYLLLNNYIIAPGMYGESNQLPYFHITDHGRKCIEARSILPYDVDGFLSKLSNIDGLDEWVEFYLIEALKCFNANCFNASTMMLGLASERLVELMIEKTGLLIGKTRYTIEVKRNYRNKFQGVTNQTELKERYLDKIAEKPKIASRFEYYNEFVTMIDGMPIEVTKHLEKSSRKIFTDYLRLNRNEVGHPSDVRKDSTETMLLILGFTKYCENFTVLLNEIEDCL